MEKKIKCPNCMTIHIVKGEPNQQINVKCPSCGNIGNFIFKGDISKQSIHSNKMVVLRNVSKRYKQLLALNNVSFEINQGEVFGYIGPNGAGKTTTIKIMIDLISKNSGEVYINGISMPEEKNKVHGLIGYLPQDVGFQKWRTVDHALMTFGRLSGLDKNTTSKRINEILNWMNLGHIRHKKIIKLSGGMVQKIGLAQALLHNPKLLILDEPLAGLDPEGRFFIKELIKKLSLNGTTVFFSSHILSDVKDLATKICILDLGRIIKIGNFDELHSEFTSENQLEVVLSKNTGKWSKINNIKGVKKIIEKKPNEFIIHIDRSIDNDEIVHKIISEFLKNNCHIRSVNILTPSLDEIYQYYLTKGESKP